MSWTVIVRSLAWVFLFVSGANQLTAQQSGVRYIYDDLARLIRVINDSNECATYEYDAVGNILSIARSTNCLHPPRIDSLSRSTANAGDATCLTIMGANFLGAAVTTNNPEVQISQVRVLDTSLNICLNISPFASSGVAKIFIKTSGGLVEEAFTVNSKSIVITQNATITRTDLSFEGAAVTIEGPAVVTIDGTHRFRSLILRNGATITHSATSATSASRLDLTVDTIFQMDATSKIDVTGRGFPGSGQADNPFAASGMTTGFQSGSTGNSGGSYGGLGGNNPNPTYGDFRDPKDPGSGGGRSFNTPGGNGGGSVRIVAQTFQLDGSIIANGGSGSINSGGGSGGGIRIDVGTLQGTGTISANGSSGGGVDPSTGFFFPGGGGGGGRIAIYYQEISGFDLNRASTLGGVNAPGGGVGTVYLQGPGREAGEIIVDSNNILASSPPTSLLDPLGGTISLTHLRARRGARVRTDNLLDIKGTLEIAFGSELVSTNRIIATTIDLNNNSLITHLLATATASFKVDLIAGFLIVDATSRIDVTGRGFLGSGQPGNPFVSSGMTRGFQSGSTGNSGGSYGGLGGGGAPNALYGAPADPDDVGSGGGRSFNAPGGNGGGLVRIVAQTFQLDGAITANGGEGSVNSGGGSGGGIAIDVRTLRGLGTISAKGARGGGLDSGSGFFFPGGGGGGGRIAIYYEDASEFDLTRVTAQGGTESPAGQDGTVHAEQRVFVAQAP